MSDLVTSTALMTLAVQQQGKILDQQLEKHFEHKAYIHSIRRQAEQENLERQDKRLKEETERLEAKTVKKINSILEKRLLEHMEKSESLAKELSKQIEENKKLRALRKASIHQWIISQSAYSELVKRYGKELGMTEEYMANDFLGLIKHRTEILTKSEVPGDLGITEEELKILNNKIINDNSQNKI